MSVLMETYIDPEFISWMANFYPYVGAGLILGLIVAVLGWLFGLVWTLVRPYLNA